MMHLTQLEFRRVAVLAALVALGAGAAVMQPPRGVSAQTGPRHRMTKVTETSYNVIDGRVKM